MTDINKIFADFLENTVNLNPDRFNRVESAERVLGEFIANSDAFKDLFVGVSRQGSARQKTIIKPVGKDDEFDVDLLITLEENSDWSPADYHSELAGIFKNSDRYKDITDTRGKTRCVTIDYNSDFHVDLVPAIERDGQMYVFNKTTDEEERTDGDGYAQWFEQRDMLANRHLVHVVRLLKYLRDAKGDFETKSIILTTIAGMQVRPGDNFEDLTDAFTAILQRINDFLMQYDEAPSIPNPAMPNENFDRHWRNDGEGFKRLKKAVGDYNDIASDALGILDDGKALQRWQDLFGDKFTESKGQVAATAIGISAPTIIFNPSKPWASEAPLCNVTDSLKKN